MRQTTIVYTCSGAGKTYLSKLASNEYLDTTVCNETVVDNDYLKILDAHNRKVIPSLIDFLKNHDNHKFIFLHASYLAYNADQIISLQKMCSNALLVMPDKNYIEKIKQRVMNRDTTDGRIAKDGSVESVNQFYDQYDKMIDFAEKNNIEIIYLNEQCPYLENALDLYERKHGLK